MFVVLPLSAIIFFTTYLILEPVTLTVISFPLLRKEVLLLIRYQLHGITKYLYLVFPEGRCVVSEIFAKLTVKKLITD